MSEWSERITINILDTINLETGEIAYREYVPGSGDAAAGVGDLDDFAEVLYVALEQMHEIEAKGLIDYNSLFSEDNMPTFIKEDGPRYLGALDAALQNIPQGVKLNIFIDPMLDSPAFAEPFSYPPAIYLNPEMLDDLFYQVDASSLESDTPAYLRPSFISVLADELFHIADRRNTQIAYERDGLLLANQNSIRSADAYNALFGLPPRAQDYFDDCSVISHDLDLPEGDVPFGSVLDTWVAIQDGLDLQLDRIHFTGDMEPGALGVLPSQALPTAKDMREFEEVGCLSEGR